MIRYYHLSEKLKMPQCFIEVTLEVFTEDMPMGLVMTNFGDGDTDYVTNGYWSTES